MEEKLIAALKASWLKDRVPRKSIHSCIMRSDGTTNGGVFSIDSLCGGIAKELMAVIPELQPKPEPKKEIKFSSPVPLAEPAAPKPRRRRRAAAPE